MGRGRILLFPTPMIRKQAGQMRKLLGLWKDNKKTEDGLINNKSSPQPTMIDGRPTFLTQEKGLTTKHITRRQIVLNRHFTEIISDELSTSMKKQLTDMGVSITSIESKAWNKGVNIFYSTNKPFDAKIHAELCSVITELRYSISLLRPMGRTPLVNFIYDENARLEQDLQRALKNVKLSKEEDKKDLVEGLTNKVHFSKNFHNQESKLDSKKFSCPSDMTNMMLGLSYPTLYDEVAAKMERGRALSSRMIPHSTLAGPSRPFIRGPIDEIDETDSVLRVHQMRKFLISQRKKAEYQAKVRRKDELLARDRVKWDVPQEEVES